MALEAIARALLFMWLLELALCCDDGDLRLVNGTSNLRGRMEVCINQEWGTVSDYFLDFEGTNGPRVSSVACRQLGFLDTGSTLIRGPGETFAPQTERGPVELEPFHAAGTGPVLLQRVTCAGSERALINCDHDRNDPEASNTGDAGVVCTPDPECTAGAVRLVDGLGRVEFCWNQAWTTLTAVNFDPDIPSVVCRQLGMESQGATATAGAGTGLGSVLSVQCTGTEDTLSDCDVIDTGGNFDHSNDVGVQCDGGGSTTTTGSPTTVNVDLTTTSTMEGDTEPSTTVNAIVDLTTTSTMVGDTEPRPTMNEPSPETEQPTTFMDNPTTVTVAQEQPTLSTHVPESTTGPSTTEDNPTIVIPSEFPTLIVGITIVTIIVLLVVLALVGVVIGWVCYCSKRRGSMDINQIPRTRSTDYIEKRSRIELPTQMCSAYGQRNTTLPVTVKHNDAYASLNEPGVNARPCVAYEINHTTINEAFVYTELGQSGGSDGVGTIQRAAQENLYESIGDYDYVDSTDRNKWMNTP